MTVLRIGSTELHLHDWGCVTRFSDGTEVQAEPQDNAQYRSRAIALGYGSNTLLMSQEHEVLHTLASVAWLGLPESKTLRGVASGHHWPHWRQEEAFVLAGQALARTCGVSILGLAEKASAR